MRNRLTARLAWFLAGTLAACSSSLSDRQSCLAAAQHLGACLGQSLPNDPDIADLCDPASGDALLSMTCPEITSQSAAARSQSCTLSDLCASIGLSNVRVCNEFGQGCAESAAVQADALEVLTPMDRAALARADDACLQTQMVQDQIHFRLTGCSNGRCAVGSMRPYFTALRTSRCECSLGQYDGKAWHPECHGQSGPDLPFGGNQASSRLPLDPATGLVAPPR